MLFYPFSLNIQGVYILCKKRIGAYVKAFPEFPYQYGKMIEGNRNGRSGIGNLSQVQYFGCLCRHGTGFMLFMIVQNG